MDVNGWDSYDGDWTNPDPTSHVVMRCISEAIYQRELLIYGQGFPFQIPEENSPLIYKFYIDVLKALVRLFGDWITKYTCLMNTEVNSLSGNASLGASQPWVKLNTLSTTPYSTITDQVLDSSFEILNPNELFILEQDDLSINIFNLIPPENCLPMDWSPFVAKVKKILDEMTIVSSQRVVSYFNLCSVGLNVFLSRGNEMYTSLSDNVKKINEDKINNTIEFYNEDDYGIDRNITKYIGSDSHLFEVRVECEYNTEKKLTFSLTSDLTKGFGIIFGSRKRQSAYGISPSIEGDMRIPQGTTIGVKFCRTDYDYGTEYPSKFTIDEETKKYNTRAYRYYNMGFKNIASKEGGWIIYNNMGTGFKLIEVVNDEIIPVKLPLSLIERRNRVSVPTVFANLQADITGIIPSYEALVETGQQGYIFDVVYSFYISAWYIDCSKSFKYKKKEG